MYNFCHCSREHELNFKTEPLDNETDKVIENDPITDDEELEMEEAMSDKIQMRLQGTNGEDNESAIDEDDENEDETNQDYNSSLYEHMALKQKYFESLAASHAASQSAAQTVSHGLVQSSPSVSMANSLIS